MGILIALSIAAAIAILDKRKIEEFLFLAIGIIVCLIISFGMLGNTVPVYTGWCYFCNKLWFDYSDGINLWARQIFIISAFLPLFTKIQKKDWKSLFLMAVIISVFPCFIDFSDDFMPDIPVGAAVVYGVLMVVLLFLLILLPHNPFQVLGLKKGDLWGKYNEMYAEADLELTETDRLECIGPDHSIYYVFPAKSELDYGVKAAETTPEEWVEQIREKGYQYLVLEEYEANFPATYQELFTDGIDSIQQWSVYDVIIEDESVRFVKRGAR